jgi:parvulin-like peptidyl-prolyl isomerase
MKRLPAILIVAAVSLTGCGELLDPAAAVVNGDKITLDAVEAGLEEFTATDKFGQLAEQGDVEAVTRQFEQGFLATLVRRSVLEPLAEDRGISIDDADVDEQMEVIKADFPSQTAFEEALNEQALNEAQLRELVYDRLLEESLRAEVTAEVTASDEEIEAAYSENLEQYQETGARHILVDDKKLAQRLASQLQGAPDGRVEALFERLARELSTDGSAEQGGDLGYAPAGQYVPPFEEAVQTLPVGTVSDPVKTEFGFHVIQVYDRRTRPFEEAREEIALQLSGAAQEQAWERFIREAYEDADVRVNPRFGELDIASGQILDPGAEEIPGGEAPAEPPQEEVPELPIEAPPAP